MYYYSTKKINEVLIHATVHMNLENVLSKKYPITKGHLFLILEMHPQ